jgi:protein tyrosine phosphatase (PTP) superfamily phosphohydrolase (DUF442 family)
MKESGAPTGSPVSFHAIYALQRTEAGGRLFSAIHVLLRQPPSLSLRSLGHITRMKNLPASLTEIYSFRAVGDRLGTAGQPSESQFHAVHEAGFEAVINLALPTSSNALAHEGSIVTGLGMSYVHIPLDFKAPTSQDFRAFCRVMAAFDERPVFVHCAANMRVSAFVFLYRVLYQHVAVSEAEQDMHAIWQPDEVWSHFIHNEFKTHEPVA